MNTAPLYFVRSGYVIVVTGRLSDANINGFYWSSQSTLISSTPGALDLNFNSTSIAASNGPTSRRAGFPLRYLGNKNKRQNH